MHFLARFPMFCALFIFQLSARWVYIGLGVKVGSLFWSARRAEICLPKQKSNTHTSITVPNTLDNNRRNLSKLAKLIHHRSELYIILKCLCVLKTYVICFYGCTIAISTYIHIM